MDNKRTREVAVAVNGKVGETEHSLTKRRVDSTEYAATSSSMKQQGGMVLEISSDDKGHLKSRPNKHPPQDEFSEQGEISWDISPANCIENPTLVFLSSEPSQTDDYLILNHVFIEKDLYALQSNFYLRKTKDSKEISSEEMDSMLRYNYVSASGVTLRFPYKRGDVLEVGADIEEPANMSVTTIQPTNEVAVDDLFKIGQKDIQLNLSCDLDEFKGKFKGKYWVTPRGDPDKQRFALARKFPIICDGQGGAIHHNIIRFEIGGNMNLCHSNINVHAKSSH